jgi:hypothetical protein
MPIGRNLSFPSAKYYKDPAPVRQARFLAWLGHAAIIILRALVRSPTMTNEIQLLLRHSTLVIPWSFVISP